MTQTMCVYITRAGLTKANRHAFLYCVMCYQVSLRSLSGLVCSCGSGEGGDLCIAGKPVDRSLQICSCDISGDKEIILCSSSMKKT